MNLSACKLIEYESACNYKELSYYCNKNIKNMKALIEIIDKIDDTSIQEILIFAFNMHETNDKINKIFILQTCLFSMLTNPFDFCQILGTNEKKIIFDFVTKNNITDKLSVKIFVKIFTDRYIIQNTKYNVFLIYKEMSKICKLREYVVQFVVSSLLVTKLCKKSIKGDGVVYDKQGDGVVDDNKHDGVVDDNKRDGGLDNKQGNNALYADDKDLQNEIIDRLQNQEDDITSLIYKIKILSHQYKYFDKLYDINIFLQYLNFDNFKFGYAISRSVTRILKYFDVPEFCKFMQSNLTDIFANEMLWINTLHILGSARLTYQSISIDISLIEKALFFNNDESNHRSILVREYALFLVYTIIRTSFTDQYINLLVYTCIFDENYKIRGIAASILSTHFNVNLKIKRLEDRLESFELIRRLYDVKIESYLSRTTNNVNTLDIKHNIIAKYNYSYSTIKHTNCMMEYLSLGYAMKYSIRYDREGFDGLSFLAINLNSLWKFRYVEVLVDLYLEILWCILHTKETTQAAEKYKIFLDDTNNDSRKKARENLIFILSKNIDNANLANVVWVLNDKCVFEFLYTNRKKTNLGIIICNIRNKKYIKEIEKEYKECIKSNTNTDRIIHIYSSLKYYEGDIKYFENEILTGLENYQLSYRGDVCYKIRLDCLFLIYYDRKVFNKYLVRYFVDKNKYIKDCIFANINKWKDIIDEYDILKEKDVLLVLDSMEKFDELNVTIGILGYIFTADNYDYNKLIDCVIKQLPLIDKNIQKIIHVGYKRVYKYIYKLINKLQDRNITEYITHWNELLKDYSIDNIEIRRELQSGTAN